jgi:hypothetical protein
LITFSADFLTGYTRHLALKAAFQVVRISASLESLWYSLPIVAVNREAGEVGIDKLGVG